MNLKTLAAVIAVTAIVATAGFTHAQNTELQSTANIYLYPRPVQISDLVLKNQFGRRVSIKDFKGKVVLLHFWSINCPACKIEEPLLEQMKRSFGASGLEILAVNLVDPPQHVDQHAAAKRIPFPVLSDGGQGFSLRTINASGRNTAFLVNPNKEAILEIPGFPTTYIIDCRGAVVAYSVGVARWDSQAALKLVQSLLADSKTCKLSSSECVQRLTMNKSLK